MNNALIVYPSRSMSNENKAYTFLRHRHGDVRKCVKDVNLRFIRGNSYSIVYLYGLKELDLSEELHNALSLCMFSTKGRFESINKEQLND